MPTPPKRPGDDALDGDASHACAGLSHNRSNKAPRLKESNASVLRHTHGDLSGAVKKKTSGSTRTGQACDRCKVRKIRCDARPGGCSPCLQNNTECKTTDRITGRATSRGHTEQIENENAMLKMYMIELQQQLRNNGLEPKPAPSSSQGNDGSWEDMHTWNSQPPSNSAADSTQEHGDRQSPQGSLLPHFRPDCIGDNYLGVSSENNWLSPIEGTSLALFGTKIDLAEFMPSESDPAEAPMSYRTFLNYAFGRTQPYTPELPPYEQCKVYAEWYFRSVQQFIPILHKPDFMDLLKRIHHDNYQSNAAETVMVHMVLAVINYQFSARNGNDQARQDAMSHYHYALSFVPELIAGHTLQDIQALTIICSQLRNQPRPGATWMFTNLVMGLAIESGLHRSARAWQGSTMNQDPHHLEMRKRIFWSLMITHVHVSGKLGRPMPLRVEDFDIEMPEPTPDHLPEETELSEWKRCSWRAGASGFPLLRIMMQVYSTIYSIKSTGQYETNVKALEKELDEFAESIPPELRGGRETTDEDRVSALYLDISIAECQLLLHHPSLCRSSSPQVMSSNLDTCIHWSGRLRSSAVQLKTLKSLDTTWYYATDFLAAIFTTLFASTERREQMDSSDLQRLRHEMDQWLDVMGEVGTLLGTGPALQSAVRGIIDFSLDHISAHVAAKTASAAVTSTASPPSQDQTPAQQPYENANSANGYYSEHSGTQDLNGVQHPAYNEAQQGHASQGPATYPPPTQYPYGTAQPNGIPYATTTPAGFDTAAYPSDQKPDMEAELAAHTASIATPQQPVPSNFMQAISSPAPGSSGFQQPPQVAVMNGQAAFPQSGPAAWRHFADNMMTNVSGQDYMNSAGALMAMSAGKPDASVLPSEMAVATMGNFQVPAGDPNQPWPLIHYNGGSGHSHQRQ
ncbi:Activator of stress 1 [Lecanosticta acicola]|uniref:Activator of stress 1 n=1 Tax=Lecanosticta acicola TaxID=111012 RepID=A0AAI9EFC8_9PEZI|nr:Activator of stress 1 [Lecanosticta acicola]